MAFVENKTATEKSNSNWKWIPTLYFAEGLAYSIVVFLSVLMYKRMGVSNAEIAFYTSWLFLPWILKPLWAPLVDSFGTKRSWILASQFILSICFAALGFTFLLPEYFQFSVIIFWVIAFVAATYETAADGFYLFGLRESDQSFNIGFRFAFFRTAIVVGQVVIVLLASQIENAMSVMPADFKVVSNPKKFFEETIKVDSTKVKEQTGMLRLIAKPSYLEISTRPKTREQIQFYKNFARSINALNGFSSSQIESFEGFDPQALAGNIGIVKFVLSKKPSAGSEYLIGVDFLEGQEGIKVLEGNELRFTDQNWNKPAFAIIQLDSTIANKTVSLFTARTQKIPFAWMAIFGAIALLFFLLFIYHRFILPTPADDKQAGNKRSSSPGKEFFRSFARFFEKKKIILIILFLLFFNFGETQIQKLLYPFLVDAREYGGLGLSAKDAGIASSAISAIAIILGGLLGGFVVFKKGLKSQTLTMMLSLVIPNTVYIYLAWAQPQDILLIFTCIGFEAFFFGFGVTFLLMYLISISVGEYRTSHYAIAAGFAAIGSLIAGMMSGGIQEMIGYKYFFIWVVVSSLPALVLAKYIPLEYQFGKKKLTEN